MFRNKKLLIVILFVLSLPLGHAYFRKVSIDRGELRGVRIEAGGMVQLNQFLKKKYKHNGKDNYRVEFICTPGKRRDKCSAVNVNILPTTLTP
jgi:hypothetical protein